MSTYNTCYVGMAAKDSVGMSPLSSQASINDEHFLRLFLLLKKVGTPLCRDLFHQFHPEDPGMLFNCMKKFEKFLQPMLFPDQKEILFGSSCHETDSASFDLTLLMMLIRKTCKGFPAPKTGWNRRPSLTDVSVGAHLVRLREFRNSLSHQGSSGFSKADFVQKWKELSSILLKLGALQSDIDYYMTVPLDSGAAKYDMVKEEVSILHDVLYQHIDVSFTKLSENEGKIDSLQKEISLLQGQHRLLMRSASANLPFEPSLPDLASRIKRSYARSEALISFLEWDSHNRGCLKLMDIYVPLTLQPWESRRSCSEVGIIGSFEEVVERCTSPLSLCIVADPGRGKTTLLKKIILDYSEESNTWFADKGFELVLLLNVEDLSNFNSLESYFAERVVGLNTRDADSMSLFLKENSEKCLFLIDGLDICDDESDMYRQLHALLKGHIYHGASVVATTRPCGLNTIEKHLSLFNSLYSIAGFTKDEIRLYIGKYFSEKDEQFCNHLHELIMQDAAICDLASCQLALTVLCSLYENSDPLPHSSTNLYHQLVYHMIQQFKSKLGCDKGQLTRRRVSHAVIKSMGHVAFKSLASGKEYFEQQDLVEYFVAKKRKTGFFRRKSLSMVDASSVLQLGFISADSGSNPRKLNWRYQFEPKLCQSYMAAEYIADAMIKHGVKGVRKIFQFAGGQQGDPLDVLKKNDELRQFVIDSLGRRDEKELCKQLFNEMFHTVCTL